MDWHGHESTALLNNLNHPVCRKLNHWMLTDLQGDLYLLLGKKTLKTRDPEFPTKTRVVKGFQLCINQSSCATSPVVGVHDSTNMVLTAQSTSMLMLLFSMLGLRWITTAIFPFSNHTCSAFQSFRHCVAVAFCRTPRTWKNSIEHCLMPWKTWCISWRKLSSKGHVKWCFQHNKNSKKVN